MERFFDNRYDEQTWRNESDARERDEIRREAADMADFHAGETPEYLAFLDASLPDAPGGRYIEQPKVESQETQLQHALAELETLKAEYARLSARNMALIGPGMYVKTRRRA